MPSLIFIGKLIYPIAMTYIDLICERLTNKYLEMLGKYIPTKIRKYDNADKRKELRIRDRLRNINRDKFEKVQN